MNSSIFYSSLSYLKSNFDLVVSLSSYCKHLLDHELYNDKKRDRIFTKIDSDLIIWILQKCNSFVIFTYLHKYYEEIEVFDDNIVSLFCLMSRSLCASYVKILNMVIIELCRDRHAKLIDSLIEARAFYEEQLSRMLYKAAKYGQCKLVLILKRNIGAESILNVISYMLRKRRYKRAFRFTTNEMIELIAKDNEHIFDHGSLLIYACIEDENDLAMHIINKTDNMDLLNQALKISKQQTLIDALIKKGAKLN